MLVQKATHTAEGSTSMEEIFHRIYGHREGKNGARHSFPVLWVVDRHNKHRVQHSFSVSQAVDRQNKYTWIQKGLRER